MTQALTAAQPPDAKPREILRLGTPRSRTPHAVVLPPESTAVTIIPSAPQPFPLGMLMRAAENVRHTRIEEDCEPLADDIMAHGLLQSLIGYEQDGKIEIVGGGRRLRALRIVKQRGLIDDHWPVPVLIRSVDEAIELSLAENLQHRTMSPVDEFFAFSKLMEGGTTSPAELAKRFGWSERLVKQRLRLAELAKPVLDALADRTITIDAAMAYASSQDRALQVEVFEHQAKRSGFTHRAHRAADIRDQLRSKGIDTANPLYKFVGAETYERDGGRYEDDLFVEAGRDRVLAQPFLLETTANSMVDLQAIRLVGELTADEAWAPTIAGFVKVPDLRLHSHGTSQPMRPPAGFVLVERGDHAKLWRTIRNNGWNVHIVVGIDGHGRLRADPRYAFVPTAQKAAVDKPLLTDVHADRMTAERAAAAARELGILRWSRRLAIPFAGTPIEHRLFWPEARYDRQVPESVRGETGFLVTVEIFVTDVEIAASRKAAAAEYDARLAKREASN